MVEPTANPTPAPVRGVVITRPNFETAQIAIIGTAPYVQLRFSEKAKSTMREKQEAGSQAKKGKQREARVFAHDYAAAMYVCEDAGETWHGLPATAIRKAAVDACRLVNFKMTLAKLSVFVEADGYDKFDGTPLIRIYGTPKQVEHAVRNATGVADLRVRAMWATWRAVIRVRYDADQFSATDVANLIARVGEQVGIGEGRPNSKESTGMGWGTFRIAEAGE